MSEPTICPCAELTRGLDDVRICITPIGHDGDHEYTSAAALLASSRLLLAALVDLLPLAEAALREAGGYDVDAELKDARTAIQAATTKGGTE